MAAGNNWPFERAGEDEIALVVTGRWTNYQVSFTWMGDIEALHLACAFDMKVPEPRLAEVQQLIAMINEQLWIGHFDVWMQNGMVMFRHALVLAGGVAASGRQCEAVLGTALDSCERYFPAFQFVIWAGKVGARSDGRRHVRDLRRGLNAASGAQRTSSAPSPSRACPSGAICLSAPAVVMDSGPAPAAHASCRGGFRDDEDIAR